MVFVAFTFLGSVVSARNILDFGDLFFGRVRRALDESMARLRAGEFQAYR